MKITIAPNACADMLAAILLCPIEISGLGRIVRQADDEFFVSEILVFEQECSAASTEFDSEAKGRWDNEMVRAGRAHEINDHHFWWHSHVCGHAYFSVTDDANIERFDGTGAPWWVSVVGNKFGELSARADFYDPRQTVRSCEIALSEPLDRGQFRELIQIRAPRVRHAMAEKVIMNMRLLSPREEKDSRWR